MLRRRRTYSGALRCEVIALGILLVLAMLFYAFESSYVLQSHVYTQEVATGFDYTALAVSDVPFYNAAGHPPIEVHRPALYSFDYFVFATNNLRPFVAVYTLAAVAAVVLIPLDTLGALLYQPLVAIMALVEAAKLVYFLLYALDLFGLECVEYPFCRNRNPAQPTVVDSTFVVAMIACGVFLIVDIFLLRLPGIVRRARLASDPIGNKMSDDETDGGATSSSSSWRTMGDEYGIGSAAARRRPKLPKKAKREPPMNRRDAEALEALRNVPKLDL